MGESDEDRGARYLKVWRTGVSLSDISHNEGESVPVVLKRVLKALREEGKP